MGFGETDKLAHSLRLVISVFIEFSLSSLVFGLMKKTLFNFSWRINIRFNVFSFFFKHRNLFDVISNETEPFSFAVLTNRLSAHFFIRTQSAINS